MLCVEEMVLCGLSCSMCVRRCSALGFSPFPLFSSVMYKLSFSLLRTLFMPPLFCWRLLLFFSCELQVFSQASVASLNSTTLSGSSVLDEIISLSSIMNSFCGWNFNIIHFNLVQFCFIICIIFYFNFGPDHIFHHILMNYFDLLLYYFNFIHFINIQFQIVCVKCQRPEIFSQPRILPIRSAPPWV